MSGPHPTSATLTVALALAESRGGVSGKDLIVAVACGNDLVSRLGLAIEGTLWDFPWVRAPVVGIFGAALAGGMIIGLEAARLRNALGFALPQAAGTLECLRGEESAVRGMRDGLIYKDAVLAVLLAEVGLPGDQGVFDGEYGLYNAYFGGRYDRARLLDGLGSRFEGMSVSLKPWPSCRHTHATLTALFELIDRPGFDPADVAEVIVHVGDGNRRLCDPPPFEYKGRMALLCNLPFATAVAVAHQRFPLSSFSEEGSQHPELRAALAKVRCVYDPEQNRHGTIEPGAVELRFVDGTVARATAERALGHPDRPMSEKLLADKVRSAAEAAVEGADTAEVADRLIDVALRLEDLADVRQLAEAATAPVLRESQSR